MIKIPSGAGKTKMLSYMGYKIVPSNLLVDHKTKKVVRTFKERLFSLPWRPLRKFKIVSYTIPIQSILITNSGKMICHPTIYEKIKKAIESN